MEKCKQMLWNCNTITHLLYLTTRAISFYFLPKFLDPFLSVSHETSVSALCFVWPTNFTFLVLVFLLVDRCFSVRIFIRGSNVFLDVSESSDFVNYFLDHLRYHLAKQLFSVDATIVIVEIHCCCDWGFIVILMD